jgi:hypothetical protein
MAQSFNNIMIRKPGLNAELVLVSRFQTYLQCNNLKPPWYQKEFWKRFPTMLSGNAETHCISELSGKYLEDNSS